MEESVTTYLIKLGELTLKGGNRKTFEKQLFFNAKKILREIDCRGQVISDYGRFFVECPGDPAEEKKVEWALDKLIGITGFAKAAVTEKQTDSIKKAVLEQAGKFHNIGIKTFKIETRRSDKKFPLNSYEISGEMGEAVLKEFPLKVDVKKPEGIINIEIREEKAFVYSHESRSNRGLPVGTASKGLLLLSGGIDSPVAGYRMLTRGMKLDGIYFHSYPYTSDEAKQKVIDLAAILAPYGLGFNLNIIPFTQVQMMIKKSAPEAYSTLMLRMAMMKTANLLAGFLGASALVTGESLGQVASQTIENMTVTESCAEFPVLRPLIGLDKQEIINTACKIGTYETSILPYEDCCVLFSPKHPVLKASKEEAHKIFENIGLGQELEKAFDEREIIRLTPKDGFNISFS